MRYENILFSQIYNLCFFALIFSLRTIYIISWENIISVRLWFSVLILNCIWKINSCSLYCFFCVWWLLIFINALMQFSELSFTFMHILTHSFIIIFNWWMSWLRRKDKFTEQQEYFCLSPILVLNEKIFKIIARINFCMSEIRTNFHRHHF